MTHHIVLSPLFPPTRFGGIEKIVYHLARELRSTGATVSVAAFEPGLERPRLSVETDGVRVVRVPCRDTSPEAILEQQAALAVAAERLTVPGQATVLQAHDWFTAPAAELLRGKRGLPILAVFHGDKWSEHGGCLDRLRREIHQLQYRLARISSRRLCYSHFLRSCLARSTGMDIQRFDLFRCGVDEAPLLPRPSRTSGSPLRVLYRGRLAQEKSVDMVIRAVQVLFAESPIELTVRGSGPQFERLKALALELGLTECVQFLPFTPDPASLEEDLSRHDVSVLPSHFEPFGLAALEAVARGVPLVVPSHGGPAEIALACGTGLTYPWHSIGGLCACLRAVRDQPDLCARQAAAAAQRAREHFSWRQAGLVFQRHAALAIRDRASEITAEAV